jgi:hypothetical protein
VEVGVGFIGFRNVTLPFTLPHLASTHHRMTGISGLCIHSSRPNIGMIQGIMLLWSPRILVSAVSCVASDRQTFSGFVLLCIKDDEYKIRQYSVLSGSGRVKVINTGSSPSTLPDVSEYGENFSLCSLKLPLFLSRK